MCQTLENAVEKGFETTSPGEVLLLSPACASMDMFKDYRERGERFKYLVKKRKYRQ
jgi:UDP-N-acetylmuramoylalanine--D-glutamate ligase